MADELEYKITEKWIARGANEIAVAKGLIYQSAFRPPSGHIDWVITFRGLPDKTYKITIQAKVLDSYEKIHHAIELALTLVMAQTAVSCE
jgi:hypothetical protein